MAHAERLEVAETIEQLRREQEALVVRGLSSVTPRELATLAAMQADLERMGVVHLAGRVDALIGAIRADPSTAAGHLFRLQAALRVAERALSFDTAADRLDPPEGDA